MKKFRMLIVISLLMLSGCTKGNDTQTDTLQQIKNKNEIIIATEGTWQPWSYHNEDNELVGYDVELGQLIAEKLGVKATFVEAEWDSLFAGLDSKRYDIVINGVEITDERLEKYDFSNPYAFIKTAIIVKSDNDEIHSYDDLSGKQTANTLASTYATLAEHYGATTTGVDDLSQTIELVLQNRVDATLNAEVTYYDYMKVHPEASLKIAALTDESSLVSIPMRKGQESTALNQEINKIIDEMIQSGELSQLSIKYFGTDLVSE
ncbi:MAG: transporter substrate-binding domain-containing protein [Anaerorhabdus sp.]|uniref:transporter substrate-binding domain-containing protein n=1 Tax=Anaerorhabdus sp. TaxID=1872524 RepID=UPI002FCB5690